MLLGTLICSTSSIFCCKIRQISVCIGVSGRIKGRACGFEVSGARGSEDRPVLKPACHPNGKGHSGEASQELGASVMPKGCWCLVQLVHTPGGAVQQEEEATPGPAARNVSRSTLQREAREAQGMIVSR